MKKSISIKTKTLYLSIVIPILLVLLFMGGLFSFQYRDAYHDARQDLFTDSLVMRDTISLEIQESFELLRNLSVNPMAVRVLNRMNTVPRGLDNDDFLDLEEAQELSGLMNRVSAGTKAELVYTATTGSSGILLSRDVQLGEGFDVRGRDYYKGALADPGRVFISEPRVSAEKTAEPKIVITAARAVVNDSGQNAGIVALNYSFDPIIAIIRELMAEYSVAITLFDTEGRYVLWNETPDNTYFFNPERIIDLEALAMSLGYTQEEAAVLVSGAIDNDSYYFEGMTVAGEAMIQNVHIPGTRWTLMVASPVSEISSSLIATILPPLLIFVAFFIVLQAFVYILYTRFIVKPLTGIGGNLRQLAEADADLTVTIPIHTGDEIGQVADSFNSFVGKLRDLMTEVKKAIEGTDTIGMSVTSSTEETSTAIEQISANLNSINKQIEILDSSIDDTVTAIEQVTQNIASMDDQIINQSAMVEESTAAITQMIASLQNVNSVAQNKRGTTQALSHVAGEGKLKIEETARTFKAVVDHINQIQDMASAINSIASQTNLLSMNAAIEAAHAGESGRGFAVVAEEIRKLADSAGKSSQSISQIIKDITESVTETDRNVADTSSAFEKISTEVLDTVNAFSEIEQSVSELNTGGQQILESTNQINEVTVTIRNGSGEIKSGTRLMLDRSAQIREVTQRVSTGMAESTTGAGEIVTSMQLMVSLSQDLKEIVSRLKEDFGQFRT